MGPLHFPVAQACSPRGVWARSPSSRMPAATSTVSVFDSILWNVVEEHLDELEFCVDSFERQLDDVSLTFQQLSKVEARLEAHLDGLVVAGDPVVERLLASAVAEVDPGEPAR